MHQFWHVKRTPWKSQRTSKSDTIHVPSKIMVLARARARARVRVSHDQFETVCGSGSDFPY